MNNSLLHRTLQSIFTVLLVVCSTQALAINAPDFSLPGDNKKVSLHDYRKKVVYVDFWASWCAPCKQSFPWMTEMQERYKKQGFEIIAINLDDDRDSALQFLERVSPGFTIAYDPEGKTAESYGLTVMPSSYLIDRKGQLTAVHKGFKTTDKHEMEEKIKSLLGK